MAKFDPFLSLDCAPRPPPWRNPRKGRDQILPSGNLVILPCLQIEFRKSFTAMRFHKFKCRRPYELLAEANKMIDVLEVDMRTLQDQCLKRKIIGSDLKDGPNGFYS